ncbi:MAG: aminotransferase class III-fold pyridoxal phosphate-dependent enzyme [Deltaproteobacteria bacterium]|nr:aminotransferase class III-fold pyridoxal phosphate-dependent enzyme [Deltaproteobacteria bacterium]
MESRNVTCLEPVPPIFWERALGSNVWDVDGNRFVDLTAGFGVANTGHAHPRVVDAIVDQSWAPRARTRWRRRSRAHSSPPPARVWWPSRAPITGSPLAPSTPPGGLSSASPSRRACRAPRSLRASATRAARAAPRAAATHRWAPCWWSPSRPAAASASPPTAFSPSCAPCATRRAGC